jgi:small conductance mechanosensitive channel
MSIDESRKQRNRRVQYQYSLLKIGISFILMVAGLSLAKYLFGWSELQDIPEAIQWFAPVLLAINPYLRYIDSVIVVVIGYFMISEISRIVYTYMRNFADHASSATVKNITKIVGVAFILSIMASIYNVDPAAALTLGSFTGLLIGFAAQTLLTNTLAGVFLLLTRPFTFGDIVTISGQTGIVKEIRIMHLHLETEDGKRAIMIPNGIVLVQVILKNLPGEAVQPIETKIDFIEPPLKAKVGEKLILRGKVYELEGGKPIGLSKVYLMDRDVGRDDLLAEVITKDDGEFEIIWEVKWTDVLDDTTELYVKYLGDETHQKSNSRQYNITLS